MDCLLCYNYGYKKTFEYKTKCIYLQTQPKKGIHQSPSKINMRNSVLQVLLTCIRVHRKMCDLQFHTNDFSIIWRINHNARVIGSNIHCDVIKQPGEAVSVGQRYCFINEHVVGKVTMRITKGCVICRLMPNISL